MITQIIELNNENYITSVVSFTSVADLIELHVQKYVISSVDAICSHLLVSL